MRYAVKRPVIAFYLLLTIVAVIGCEEDKGVAPIREKDFWRQTNGPGGGHLRSFGINASGHIFAGTWGSAVFCSVEIRNP